MLLHCFGNYFHIRPSLKSNGCGRTKTSYVVKTLAKFDARDLVALLKKSAFSIATDGSNDIGAVKLYPIAVRVFDDHSGRVLSSLLSLKECEKASTGQNIFDILDAELMKSEIPWVNCSSFSTDNAPVMVGKHNGVATNQLMSRVERVNVVMLDINTKLYCLYLKNALAIFNNANVYLQKDEPVIHKLLSVLCAQLRDVLKPHVHECRRLISLLQATNWLMKIWFVGTDTSEYISTCSTELALTQLYSSVRIFYEVACKYMITKLYSTLYHQGDIFGSVPPPQKMSPLNSQTKY